MAQLRDKHYNSGSNSSAAAKSAAAAGSSRKLTYLWFKSLLSLRMAPSLSSTKYLLKQQQEEEDINTTTMKKCNSNVSSTSTGSNGSSAASDSSSSFSSTDSQARRRVNNNNGQQQQQSRRRASSHVTTTQPPLSREQQTLLSYVPNYMKAYVYPYHGEFCYTPIFRPRFIAQLMAEGFLPVATHGMLLPKLHLHRCVIKLPEELHVSKSVRKKSKRFTISVNKAPLNDIIQGCHEQHGRHCWLYPPLVAAFRDMMAAEQMDASPPPPPTTGMDISAAGGRSVNSSNSDRSPAWTVRLYTVEVWNAETGALAGGELGYTVGSIYTSLTGFMKEDSAGSVQLVALGRLLSEKGFTMWDLGMDMEYKRGIGSKLMPRETFVHYVRSVRETHGHLVLPSGEAAKNCKDVIDRNQPQPQSQENNNNQKQPKKKKTPKANNKNHKLQGNGIAAGKADLDREEKDELDKVGSAAGPSKALAVAKEPSHTPPLTEAEAPTKRVRKSDSSDECEC